MSNHQDAAKGFLRMAGAGNVQEAYDRYVAPSFIHHNQYFKGDRQSLLTAMQEASKTSPNRSIDIKHVYEDGETVITHSLVTRQDPHAPEIAVVHIFRFERDRIAELEKKRDVTCWTSFRQLDNFIAEMTYSDAATLTKIVASKALVESIWIEATKKAAGGPVDNRRRLA